MRVDPYEFHDPVFGVKESLVVDLSEVADESMAKEHAVPLGTKLIDRKFVLESSEGAEELRREAAKKVMGHNVGFHAGRPVLGQD